MIKNTNIVVIGGGPAGVISAVTAHKYYPDKKILVIKNVEEGVIPCGIPYMFSSLKDPDENRLGTAPLEEKGVKVVVGEAVSIAREEKNVKTVTGEIYSSE